LTDSVKLLPVTRCPVQLTGVAGCDQPPARVDADQPGIVPRDDRTLIEPVTLEIQGAGTSLFD